MIINTHRRLQESWQEILPQSEMFADRLYQNLFLLHPELRPLFIRSMGMQGRKLISMFTTVIDSLNEPEQKQPSLLATNQRHIHYGVAAEDYSRICAALIMTLQEFLGERFDDELQDQWKEACTIIQQAMRSGTTHVIQPWPANAAVS